MITRNSTILFALVFYMHVLRHIRPFLSLDSPKSVALSVITYRLDLQQFTYSIMF